MTLEAKWLSGWPLEYPLEENIFLKVKQKIPSCGSHLKRFKSS